MATVRDERIMHLANFNITFGEEEAPMLEYFEKIIFPAFTAKYKRGKEGEPRFYFTDVKIKEIDGRYALVGNYIKDTKYEVYTTIDKGKLVPNPSEIPTAPYSRFIILLENHRMVLVRNESQSPDIRSFQLTIKDFIKRYRRNYNKKIQNKEKKLPKENVNIVDIQLSQDVKAYLEENISDIKKVKYLRVKFFPLNNDIDPSLLARGIGEEMKKLRSSRAQLRYTSPGSMTEIKNVIDSTDGTGMATTILDVEDESGTIRKITSDKMKSSRRIVIGGNVQESNDDYIAMQAKKDKTMETLSPENIRLYEKFVPIIEKLKNMLIS